jgi:hypothetical protein
MRALDVVGIGDLVNGTEDDMTKTNFLKMWSVVVGAMDALTGMLLIIAPAAALGLLQIEPPSPDALVFLSWIGVFVMAVGLSYGLALGKHRGRGETVWLFTSLVRMLVAVFLTVMIVRGSLASAWAVVALSDGAVAVVQMVVLRKGWWREAAR